MRPPLRLRLSPGQVAALERHYRRASKPAERTRFHIILLSHQGYTPPAIAAIVRVDPATVRRAIHRYERGGLRGLLNRPRPGRPRKVTPDWERLLVQTIETDPRAVGVLRAAWTPPPWPTTWPSRPTSGSTTIASSTICISTGTSFAGRPGPCATCSAAIPSPGQKGSHRGAPDNSAASM